MVAHPVCCSRALTQHLNLKQPARSIITRPPCHIPHHSWSDSGRAAHVRAHVFDKIKDMLSGGSSGWAGPPEGQPAAAEEQDDGAEMVRIDAESTGGLGGTTEEVLGPLVSWGKQLQGTYNLSTQVSCVSTGMHCVCPAGRAAGWLHATGGGRV